MSTSVRPTSCVLYVVVVAALSSLDGGGAPHGSGAVAASAQKPVFCDKVTSSRQHQLVYVRTANCDCRHISSISCFDIEKRGQEYPFNTPGDINEKCNLEPPMTSKKSGSGSGSSSLDRSTSAAFAFFSRRHSASLNLRRSVSSVSSRRHSSPINTEANNGAASTSDTEDAGGGPSGNGISRNSSFPRSLRWRLLARKVLGNVEEEDNNGGGGTQQPRNSLEGKSQHIVQKQNFLVV